ncbi:uncharacterized protein LOC128882606 [Hylaeus volcanicus]|uniref:uncharacterized protein LOC128882606 n=1 Tax=Hylaeus volcanicus TaxID=313075 RepID=UPI0023B79B8D|nr:uncharacterized protein LOC128882606 [Hylaeus volcanicus]
MISSAHVPWYNEHEWYHVYESLFQSHNNIEQQQWAITRISFWEQRCSNTPISISATKLLIQASITDRTSSCSISQDQVQMLYGIAIVRFINTYVDAEQRKYYAESISNLGCKLGIPSELVECRHRITHNADLPSIELLRHHAKLSLEYIVTTYWEPQAEMIRQRYTYSKHSTQFLLGLMALYLDLERFTYSSSFFETQISVKHSNGIKTQSFSPLSVYQHLLKLRHLRSERRQLKRLANRLHTTEEELLGNKNFIEILQCLRDWEGGFKNLLMFSRDFLCDASYDETVLSFIKDWVLIRRHPQNKNNMFVVFFIFFILNFVSVNLTYKLVEALLKTILSPVSSSYEMEENINTTLDKTIPFKRKISDPTNEVKKQYYAAWEKIFIKQSSIKTTQVSHHDSSKLKEYFFSVCFFSILFAIF